MGEIAPDHAAVPVVRGLETLCRNTGRHLGGPFDDRVGLRTRIVGPHHDHQVFLAAVRGDRDPIDEILFQRGRGVNIAGILVDLDEGFFVFLAGANQGVLCR